MTLAATSTAPEPQPTRADLLASVSAAIDSWEEARPTLHFSSAWQTEVEGGEPVWIAEWRAPERRHPTKKTRGTTLRQHYGKGEVTASLIQDLEEISLRLGISISMVARPEDRTLVWWDDADGGKRYAGEDEP